MTEKDLRYVVSVLKGESPTRTFEEFLLREDENKQWKIVGWRLTDPIEIEE